MLNVRLHKFPPISIWKIEESVNLLSVYFMCKLNIITLFLYSLGAKYESHLLHYLDRYYSADTMVTQKKLLYQNL